MTDARADLDFADAFPPADEARWRKLALAALKGAPFERLVSQTADGQAVQPLYGRPAEAGPRPWRAASGPWSVCARVDHPDPGAANPLLLQELETGADAIHLAFAGSPGAHGFGLPPGRGALAAALAGVKLETRIPFELDLSRAAREAPLHLAEMIEAAHIDPASYPLSFGLDPLGWQAALGESGDGGMEALAGVAQTLTRRGWRGRFAVADGRIVNSAGGAPARELAFVLSSALAYWRALEAAGFSLEAGRAMLGFRLAADADEFISISKIRALRLLWARVEQAGGVAAAPIHIHAETSWRMMSRLDPHVNILRGTVAVFSAGLGGADAVSALPFTQAHGLPGVDARRIARNTQLLLIEESNLWRVADPVAGSGGFEALTSGLCEQAWAMMRDIEAAGGLGAALAGGVFQACVAADRAARDTLIANGGLGMIGVTDYRADVETPVETLAPPPAANPDRTGALRSGRDAEPFET